MNINRDNYEAYFLDYMEGTLSEKDCLAVELFLSENPDLALEIEGELPSLIKPNESVDLGMLKKEVLWEESEISELLLNKLEGELDGIALPHSETHRLNQFKSQFPERFQKLEKLINLSVATPRNIQMEELNKLGMLKFPKSETETKLIAALEGDLTLSERTELDKELVDDSALAKDYLIFQNTVSKSNDLFLSGEFKNSLKRKEGIVIPLWVRSMSAVAAVFIAVLFVTGYNGSESEFAEFSPREKGIETLISTLEETPEGYESFVSRVESSFDIDEERNLVDLTTDPGWKEVAFAENPEGDRYKGSTSEKMEVMALASMDMSLKSEVYFSRSLRGEEVKLSFSELAINQVDDEALAEVVSEQKVYTPLSLVRERVIDRIVEKDNEESLALALLNRTAEKLSEKEEAFIAYEKPSEDTNGFKFKLGRFSIESTR